MQQYLRLLISLLSRVVLPEKLGVGVRSRQKTDTLIMTKIYDFPYSIYGLIKDSIPRLWPLRLALLL